MVDRFCIPHRSFPKQDLSPRLRAFLWVSLNQQSLCLQALVVKDQDMTYSSRDMAKVQLTVELSSRREPGSHCSDHSHVMLQHSCSSLNDDRVS